MRKTILILALLALVSAIPAAADTFTLGVANAPIGFPPGTPGNWGTVTLTNTGGGVGGSGQVTITVTLAAGYTFAGGGDRFGLNNNVTLAGATYTATGDFNATPSIGLNNMDGFGQFDVRWSGGTSPSGTTVTFVITLAGLTASNLETTNNNNFEFAAHIFGPCGTVQNPCAGNTNGNATFFVGNGAGNPVPEPSSLLLLGSGLTGLAGMIRRRIKK